MNNKTYQRIVMVMGIINILLLIICISFFTNLRSTATKVSLLLETHDVQKEIIKIQKDRLDKQVYELEKSTTTTTERDDIDYNIAWEDIPTYEMVNNSGNDTWQNTLFVPNDTFKKRTLMSTYDDYPNISYEKNCTDTAGCVFDDLHSKEKPNSYVWYEYDTAKIKVPYNSVWGNNSLAVAPYIETSGKDISWKNVDVSLNFGGPYASAEGGLGWFPGRISLDIYTYDDVDEFYNNLDKDVASFIHPQKASIENGHLLKFTSAGLGEHKNLIYITNDNIIFALNTDEKVSFEELEDIVRAIEL